MATAGDEHVSEGHDLGPRVVCLMLVCWCFVARRHSPTFIRWCFGLTTWATPSRSIFTISLTGQRKSKTSTTLRWTELYFGRNLHDSADFTNSLYFMNADVQRAVVEDYRKNKTIDASSGQQHSLRRY